MSFGMFVNFFIYLGLVCSEHIPPYSEDSHISLSPTDLEVNLPILNFPIRETESSKEIDEISEDVTTITPRPRDSDASHLTKQDFVTVQQDILNITVIPTDQTEQQNVSVVQPEVPEVIIIESYDKQNISTSLFYDSVAKLERKETDDRNESLNSSFHETSRKKTITPFSDDDSRQLPTEDHNIQQNTADKISDLLDDSSKSLDKQRESHLSDLINAQKNTHSPLYTRKTAFTASTDTVHHSEDLSTMLEQIKKALRTNSFQRNSWHTGVGFNKIIPLLFSESAFGTDNEKTYPLNMGKYKTDFHSLPSIYDNANRVKSRNHFYTPRLPVKEVYDIHSTDLPHIVQTFKIPSPPRTSPQRLNPKTVSKFGYPDTTLKSDLQKTNANMRSRRELNRAFSKNSYYYSPLAELMKPSVLDTTSMIPASWIGSPESSIAMPGGPQFSYLPPSELYLPPYRIDDLSHLHNIQRPYGNVRYDALAARRVYGSIYMNDPQKRTSTELTKSASCRCGVRIAQRVTGGTTTVISRHPWMAQLLAIYFNNAFICGGTIISDRYILTAAHCFDWLSPKEVYIKLGASRSDDPDEGESFEIEDVIIHERYKEVQRYDIALVKLAETIQFSPTILPICLPSTGTIPNEGIVTGWGSTEENGAPSAELQEASVKVYSNTACNRISNYPRTDLPSSILCAREDIRVDSCQGDSGGPLVLDSPSLANVYQMGITSWGVGCGNYRFPGVYTRIASYVWWIRQKTRDSNYCSADG